MDLLFIPAMVTPTTGYLFYEGGAFRTEQEAQAVVDTWVAEGRTEELVINYLPFYESLDEWSIERGQAASQTVESDDV